MSISTTAPSIGWLHPWPEWIWMILIAVCVFTSIWAYRRTDLPSWVRWSLTTLRFAILMIVLVYISGPVIETRNQERVDDKVIILLDRSTSMTTMDVVSEDGSLGTREDQLTGILGASNVWKEISRDRTVEWYGFDDHSYVIADPTVSESPLPPPAGDATDISMSIEQISSGSMLNPISSIVLLSDGRSTQPVPRGLTAKLRSKAIPIISIPLGSTDGRIDIGIESTRSPAFAYMGDKVPVIVDLSRSGTGENAMEGDLVLRSIDSGEEYDRIPIESGRSRFTLVGEPAFQGDTDWIVELEPTGDDLVSMNNTKNIRIELVEDPLRVLYIDGYPRWEYRYLKNLLIRETSIESSIMLLSADNDYAQEGDRPITRLPSSMEEFEDFDIIIIGDIPSSSLSNEQQNMIDSLVGDGSLGIMWIAGPRWTPSDWKSSVLSNTIPFNAPIRPERKSGQVHVEPTDEADRIGVLQIEQDGRPIWESVLSNPDIGWPAMQWMQSVERKSLKPTTQILASIVDTDSTDTWSYPVVLSMRYGAGRSIYNTTDEIWRWRHGYGERLYEQFWIQLIRSLLRSTVSDDDQAITIELSPPVTEVGRPQRVTVRVLDESIIDDIDDIIDIELVGEQSGTSRRMSLIRVDGNTNTWTTTWVPMQPGRYTLDLLPPLPSDAASSETTVIDPGGEMANPATNHALLLEMSEGTGGVVVSPTGIQSLPERIPDRSITSERILQRSIWSNPWLLIIPVLLVGIEWMGRRVFRLA
mgnify:CR=1 FL=1